MALTSPNPNIPVLPQTHPIIPPNPTLQFVNPQDRLTAPALQFLQQLYSAVRGINSGESLSEVFDIVFGGEHGSVIYRDESVWAALEPGTPNSFLTTHGPDNSPTWSAPPSSGVGEITAGTGLTTDVVTATDTSTSITISLIVPVSIIHGGTGAITAPQALINLGAAPINSPLFTGDPRAPTPAPGDNDTSIATTAFVKQTVTDNRIVTDDNPPSSPMDGDAWWDSTNGQLYIFYDDGTSAQWVAASNQEVPVPIISGGTGATTAPAALVNLGAAPIVSPTFTGIPAAPTAAFGTSTTQIATTEFVVTGDIYLQDQIDDIATGGGIGTITGVAAGTGLTGGGTAGGVTLSLITPVAIAHGGTGATTATTARTNLGAAGSPVDGGSF